MSALRTAGLYWHTLRYLRPVQFYGRAWFRLYTPRPGLAPAPGHRAPSGGWQPPARRAASLTGPGQFFFLNQHGALADVGWNGSQREKLWRYNQHYFDDLNAGDAARRASWHPALIADWLGENPPGEGVGWEPYPTSLRIVNWIKWVLDGNALPPGAMQSLAVQARWLSRRLEYHLLGNHLFSNAKALIFAGLFFEGNEAKRWLRTGLGILKREVVEQILADGGHFERSPMYHALVLEDMLDLINLTGCYAAAEEGMPVSLWRARARDMLAWLHAMSHPDGAISFFNDAAFGVAPDNDELDRYAARLGIEVPRALPQTRWLQASGYARLERGAAVALLDMAPVGPDYLPGHAHADTLSFELSLFGDRVLVNSGTSCYGAGAERHRQRGTAAHNTVIVEGQNSSEVWGGFRVARRARPMGAEVVQSDALHARCAHDGYRRLAGSPSHERNWMLADGVLTVRDRVEGGSHAAEARFHFHPDVTLQPGGDARQGTGATARGGQFSWRVAKGRARIETSIWHPRFGESWPNQCLAVTLEQGWSELELRWDEDRV
ncbi:MAG: heparinase II/III family protein [Parvibaculum sp.]|nr:heparinase II/III family protein [Parvibaculum sp.]